MVFGERESGVVLMAVGVAVFCWVLLMAMSAEPSGAQTGGTTGVTTRAQNDDDKQIQYDDKQIQYDDDIIRKNRVTIVEEQTVITRTIPDRPLPPTGGLPVYVMVGGSVLSGAGLLALRFATQRGHHR